MAHHPLWTRAFYFALCLLERTLDSDVQEGEVEVVSALDLGHARVGQRLDEGRYDLIFLVPMACNVNTRRVRGLS